jgi:phage I-like protein
MVKPIKKRTKAQTPAPKKDKVTGSKTNPKGSASGGRGGIEIGEKAVKALENMRDQHNAKYKKSSRRVDMGMLKAVFRRGAGAFSVSHRPGMTRTQWALARVRTFIKLVGTGQRKKAYNTDLDLLPKGHPQRTEKKAEALAPQKYSHIDFSPPQGAREAAERALEVRASKPPSQRGMTDVGIARARDLKAGKDLSPETVRRMLAYFTRHEVDKQGETWDEQGKGWQAWHGWGGDAGFAWARKVVKQMNSADDKSNSLRAYGEAIQLSEAPSYNVPDDLTIGKPFKTLGLGQVSSRMNGENIGQEITSVMLEEMLRVYQERKEKDPVIIDWQHATSPFQGGPPAPPESGNALGMIIDLELREDGLYAVPAYNERGLKVVSEAGGVLWSSPEFITGEVFDRLGGNKVGDAQLLAITLTPRPAQLHAQIDRVTLNERLEMDNLDSMSAEDLRDALKAKDEMVKELERKISEMQEDAEASLKAESDDDSAKMAEEDDDKKKKMAEEDDKSKMAEEDDDKKKKMGDQYNKLSESSSLLSEVASLRETVATLTAERDAANKKQAVNALLSEGCISPAEENVAGKAWELRDLQPEFWAFFSERKPSQAVPLNEVGHGASGEEINKKSLDQRVTLTAESEGISYSEALTKVRRENPDFYNQAFGG